MSSELAKEHIKTSVNKKQNHDKIWWVGILSTVKETIGKLEDSS